MSYLTVKRAIEILQTLDSEILVTMETPDGGGYLLSDHFTVWNYDDGREHGRFHCMSFKYTEEALDEHGHDEITVTKPMGL